MRIGNMDRAEIILEISKRHPSTGMKKGWSIYTGGMKDSGHWYFEKMLKQPIEILQAYLDELIDEEEAYKNRPIYFGPEPTQNYMLEIFFRHQEYSLWFGKDYDKILNIPRFDETH